MAASLGVYMERVIKKWADGKKRLLVCEIAWQKVVSLTWEQRSKRCKKVYVCLFLFLLKHREEMVEIREEEDLREAWKTYVGIFETTKKSSGV